jgi:FkbM family methyltransferase
MLLNFNELVEKYNMKIKGVIHIGAHYGQEHQTYKNNNIEHISYFEPLSKTFEVLSNNITDGSKLFNFALGNDNKKIDMFVETANQGQSSSILQPKLHLTQYPNIVFNNIETVEMKRLDDVDIDFENYNFINIDVQGYELEVFKGATNFLKNVDYIMSEINRDEVYVDCAKVDELNNFLGDFGFKLVETTWDGGIWGDGLYIKTN